MYIYFICSNIITKANNRYNKTEVIEAMVNNEEENDKIDNKSKIDYSQTSWNLQNLYKSEDEWNNELKKFTSDTRELKNYVGKVTKI